MLESTRDGLENLGNPHGTKTLMFFNTLILYCGSITPIFFSIVYKKHWFRVYNILNLKLVLKNGQEVQYKYFNAMNIFFVSSILAITISECIATLIIVREEMLINIQFYSFFFCSLLGLKMYVSMIIEIAHKLLTFKQVLIEESNDSERIENAIKFVLKILKDIDALDFVSSPQTVLFFILLIILSTENIIGMLLTIMNSDRIKNFQVVVYINSYHFFMLLVMSFDLIYHTA